MKFKRQSSHPSPHWHSQVLSQAAAMTKISGSRSERQQGSHSQSGRIPVPHAEILGAVKDKLAKEGVNVEIIEFTDYVQPNLALNDKTLMRTTSSTNHTWMNSSSQEI